MRLIDADALMEQLEELNVASFYESNKHSNEAYNDFKQAIQRAPTVDAIRVGTEFYANDFTVFAIPEQHVEREGMFGIHKIYGKFRIEKTPKIKDCLFTAPDKKEV